MTQSCFVCDIRIGTPQRQAVNIFTETISRETTVASLLSLVLERGITKDTVHSQVICKKCHKNCIEYQLMHLKLREAKAELQRNFRSTLAKKKAVSTADNKKSATMPVVVKEEPKAMARLVLPASRLQPLPVKYLLDVDKLSTPTGTVRPKIVTLSSTHVVMPASSSTFPSPVKIAPYPIQRTPTKNIVTTVSSTMQKPLIVTGIKPSNEKETSSAIKELKEHIKTANSLIIKKLNKKQPPVVSFNVNMLPKKLLSGEKTPVKVEPEIGDDLSNDTNDDHAMEIDEDCNYVRVPAAPDSDLTIDENLEKDAETSILQKPQFVSVERVSNNSDSNMEQAQDNDDTDDDRQTIVMEDEDGSILQMVSGQKFYSTGDLTLVMPSDQEDDGNESNDESQIELQVSGDEETAQAIIAAAQEQGGAFIKVESGEMFRVKSVKSQSVGDPDEANYLEMVKEENGKFVCLLCNNATKDDEVQDQMVAAAEEMMQHLKERHNARLYICWVCNRIMRRRADLSTHLATHDSPEAALIIDRTKHYACNICEKKYNSKTLLQEHMNIHSGKRPYVCNVCGKAFASKYTHQAHLKTHLERPRPFKCQQCPKAFLNHQNLAQHEKTHLGIKDFVCSVCNKAFGTQHNLEVHRVVHLATKPFTCDTCGKGFARRNEVKDHMRIHTGERPFRCDICGAAFAQRSNLSTHTRATHLNEARYACTQCPKRFKRRRLLDYHLKASHTGERPLVCDICNSTFVYPEHYRKHRRIHSGEKPYDCEVCGKTFNSRDNRNTHRFVHSDKKPYECLVCGAGYMRKQLLYAHMNTSGHLAESIVVNQPRVQKVSTRDKIATASITENSNSQDEEIVYESSAMEIHDNNQEKTEGEEVTKIYLTSTTNDGKYVLDGKTVINLEVDGDENALLSFLNNMDPSAAKPESQVVTTTTEQLAGDQVQLVSPGDVPNLPNVRLVQVKMQNGAMGWVAVGD